MCMNTDSFNDYEYDERVFGGGIDKGTLRRMKKAFELAHDVRKFEIELFWKRGTYYWAFILASFTGYFAAMNKFLGQRALSFCTLARMPPFSKLALLVISFLCFFFCISWVLINKGSKFWQKNWERHIDVLEGHFSGKLYQTFLNTNHSDFKKCPMSMKAYDFSVTKVTTLGSIVLTTVSALLCLLHTALLFEKTCAFFTQNAGCISVVAVIGSILVMIVAVVCLMTKCVGNADEREKQGDVKNSQGIWRQRNEK